MFITSVNPKTVAASISKGVIHLTDPGWFRQVNDFFCFILFFRYFNLFYILNNDNKKVNTTTASTTTTNDNNRSKTCELKVALN